MDGVQGVTRHTTPAAAVRNTTPHGLPGAGGLAPLAGHARSGLSAAARKRKAEGGPGFR